MARQHLPHLGLQSFWELVLVIQNIPDVGGSTSLLDLLANLAQVPGVVETQDKALPRGVVGGEP